MNKVQFAEAIAREAGLTKAEARKAVEASIQVAAEAFRNGDGLTLTGLGSFSVVLRPVRMGRNPRTGAPVPIPARGVVKFRSVLDMG